MFTLSFVTENQEVIKGSIKRRGGDPKLVDDFLAQSKLRLSLKKENEGLRKDRNSLTKEISDLKKGGKDFSSKQVEAQKVHEGLVKSEEKLKKVSGECDLLALKLPNVLQDDVPDGESDKDNKEIRKVGEIVEGGLGVSHGEFLEDVGLADFSRASKVSGSGFYFLKNGLVKLELALVSYVVDFLSSKGFSPIVTPHFLRRDFYEGVTDLSDFEDVMYGFDDGFLIATSEHILAGMYSGEVFSEDDLPLRLCGVSNCFRREIGSHGVDTRGLFRVHEFRKVEMFVLCKEEDSFKIHEELLNCSEEVLKSLGLAYRVVLLCGGDTGSASSKTYDVEAWFPRQKGYGEVSSVSNCLSYQSVARNVKCLVSGEKRFVHTLNGTGVAVQRLLACIVENYYEDGKVRVPEVLRKYVGEDFV